MRRSRLRPAGGGALLLLFASGVLLALTAYGMAADAIGWAYGRVKRARAWFGPPGRPPRP